MPEPRQGETRESFMDRCIPMLINEGRPQDQAVATCSSIWDRSKYAEFNIICALAESCLKAIGPVGPEGITLSVALTNKWVPLVTAFLNSILSGPIDLERGRYSYSGVESQVMRFRPIMSEEFVEPMVSVVESYVDLAYDRGLVGTAPRLLRLGKATIDDAIENLVEITGSSRQNVRRTIGRWFGTTQGQYFERFIVPETARLASYVEDAVGNTATLNSIGRKYKAFVEGRGYWDAVADYDVATSKAFAQLDSLHEAGVRNYVIVSAGDNLVCEVCDHLDGTQFSVEAGMAVKNEILVAEPEGLGDVYPFPNQSTFIGEYPDPGLSPYPLPPYHCRCRCDIVPL